ncbi:hypothetical protein CspeluHIS016_0110370 [Cutaneotrichosporon spelunceum]|uniref:Mid2 domain-containing protein n=1 Tax=Cutaneotrichosporon spelunceum TaxID=1672016 RepID=A0AAD3TQ42_9TREE|nr:hypothetical protein CspeluHIS016_0110370 [Cutaneotrichosporon spelunceum]
MKALAAALLLGGAWAGYITVGMNEARQCNTSLVEWYGDDGPYHLLLTPTQFVSHGFNVWVPSIPNGTNSYNLSIDQPAGLQYMVTVWGASGIEYAGTTDVQTVQPSDNNSCFLPDDHINGLYTFAFNISNSDGLPAQCSNLSISWPTSLESNITGARRSLPGDEEVWNEAGTSQATVVWPSSSSKNPLNQRQNSAAPPTPTNTDQSSSKTKGNTTVPPTIFGIIPLGNSFNIPITYADDVKFADDLPPQSLSDNPTTWTHSGVTYLNWTVALAKGTRFILVAGMGDEWASGGSSEMMTVGQGQFDCFGNEPKPSVTAVSSTGALNLPTSVGPSNQRKKENNKTGIIIACVFGALGTLAAMTLLYCCCRVRSRRREARKNGLPTPSIVNLATFGRLEKRSFLNRGIYVPGNRDTQLDLLDDSRRGSTWSRAPGGSTNSRPATQHDPVVEVTEPVYNLAFAPAPARPGPQYDSSIEVHDYAYDHPFVPPIAPSPGSPATPSPPAMEYPQGYTRVPSSSARAPHSPTFEQESGPQKEPPAYRLPPATTPLSHPPPTHTPPPLPLAPVPVRRGPLVLHNTSALDEASTGDNLKRDTLAMPRAEGSRPRRRRTDDEVIVHRDAGRVRRIELPPRYDELDWDAEAPLSPSMDNSSPSPRSPRGSLHPYSPSQHAGQHGSPQVPSPYDPPFGPYMLNRPISLASLEAGACPPLFRPELRDLGNLARRGTPRVEVFSAPLTAAR